MSRSRHYSEAAQRKRTPLDHFPDTRKKVPVEDDDDLEWYDEPEQEQTQEKPE